MKGGDKLKGYELRDNGEGMKSLHKKAKSKAIENFIGKKGKRAIEKYNSLSHEERMKSGAYFSYGSQRFEKRKRGTDLAGVKRGRGDRDVRKYYGK